MCVCFTTGKEKYKYKDLLSYFDEESWRADYKIENSRKYINKRRGIDTTHKSEDKQETTTQPATTTNQLFFDNLTKEEINLTRKRIKAMFILAKGGKDFKNCREIACFIIRNWCMQLKYTQEKTKQILTEFNNLLKEPLSEKELFQNTCSKKLYKFTNTYLKHTLNLTEKEAMVFAKRYRPGDRKERTLIDKVNIAKLLLQGLSSEEICNKLSISLSLLKRRRVEMKKEEGLEYWANYKMPDKEKTIITLVKQMAEKIGIRSVDFRKFIESITKFKNDIYNECKDKCSVLLEMLIGYMPERNLSYGYG